MSLREGGVAAGGVRGEKGFGMNGEEAESRTESLTVVLHAAVDSTDLMNGRSQDLARLTVLLNKHPSAVRLQLNDGRREAVLPLVSASTASQCLITHHRHRIILSPLFGVFSLEQRELHPSGRIDKESREHFRHAGRFDFDTFDSSANKHHSMQTAGTIRSFHTGSPRLAQLATR